MRLVNRHLPLYHRHPPALPSTPRYKTLTRPVSSMLAVLVVRQLCIANLGVFSSGVPTRKEKQSQTQTQTRTQMPTWFMRCWAFKDGDGAA